MNEESPQPNQELLLQLVSPHPDLPRKGRPPKHSPRFSNIDYILALIQH